MNQTLKGLVVALSITTAAACMITVAAGGATAPQAHAFGWSDIKSAAGKVGGAVKDAGKQVGKDIKNSAKIVGREVGEFGDSFGHSVKAAGKDIKNNAKRIGRGVAERAAPIKEIARGAKDLAKDAVSAAYDHSVIRTAINPGFLGPLGLGGASCGDIGRIGKLGCDFAPSLDLPRPASKPTPPAGGPGSWGPNRNPGGFNGPIKGVPDTSRITRKGPATGFAKKALARDRSTMGRPIGIAKTDLRLNAKKAPIARDRSILGRPVGIKKNNGARDRSVLGRPAGITKSDQQRKRAKSGIARDRSLLGRTVGITTKNLKHGGQRKTRMLTREARSSKPGRTVQGITRKNLRSSGKKVQGFATKDRKLRRGNNRLRIQTKAVRKRGAEKRGGEHRNLRTDRRSSRKGEMRRNRGSGKNRKGRRG